MRLQIKEVFCTAVYNDVSAIPRAVNECIGIGTNTQGIPANATQHPAETKAADDIIIARPAIKHIPAAVTEQGVSSSATVYSVIADKGFNIVRIRIIEERINPVNDFASSLNNNIQDICHQINIVTGTAAHDIRSSTADEFIFSSADNQDIIPVAACQHIGDFIAKEDIANRCAG